MGDRVCVIFFDQYHVSPTVYLHWHGHCVPGWLTQLAVLMKGRHLDAAYAAARFVGICHSHINGNLSLGITSNNLNRDLLENETCLIEESPGDAGCVVVNTSDFSWKAYGGYLAHGSTERVPT